MVDCSQTIRPVAFFSKAQLPKALTLTNEGVTRHKNGILTFYAVSFARTSQFNRSAIITKTQLHPANTGHYNFFWLHYRPGFIPGLVKMSYIPTLYCYLFCFYLQLSSLFVCLKRNFIPTSFFTFLHLCHNLLHFC